ncbi:MAG TPA: (2Fe-2S)-binding protein [Desulfuromonadales bacterium]|nr:(2Fe-2S)-binding protein [Desulfuromonadales bacterium]
MLKRLHEDDDRGRVTIEFEGTRLSVPAGETVAAAVLAAGTSHTRTTAISGQHRGPYCQMGICFECLMEIDGVPNRQACMIQVRDGMTVNRQYGARGLNDEKPL